MTMMPRYLRRNSARLLCLLACAAPIALTGCGSDSESTNAPKGSADNPLVADQVGAANEGEGADGQAPGYHKLVERQTAAPEDRFTPCNLVTRSQARTILGAPIQQPLEAPQGPTCIYRSRDGKSFVTLAVQQSDIGALKGQMRQREKVDVGSRTAYCGNYGQPMLYVPLPGGNVLSVAGHCDVAARFAETALPRLSD
jgi:hypothetical protein